MNWGVRFLGLVIHSGGGKLPLSMSTAELGTDILREVSRSFYLTLRLLPSEFRGPLSLGYLLARMSDTIADAGLVDPGRRRDLLEQFRLIIGNPEQGDVACRFTSSLPGELEGKGLSRGEWDLVLRAGDCFEWLGSIDERCAKEIRTVVGIITEGQRWDLERFSGGEVVRLEDDEELETYAYQVAGSVGEFWTKIGFICSEQFSREQREVLLEWGANYGKGLQLVNILRDIPEDLEKGRCYLPGVEPVNPEELLTQLPRWHERARALLADGLRYTESLVGSRIKVSTGLPALLGLKTLKRLQGASWEELQGGVKISRRVVKGSLLEAYARSSPWLPGSWKGIARKALSES